MKPSLFSALLLGSALLAACGGDGGAPDAGTGNPRLVILDPPGDALGLAFAGQTTLRVRYETDAGDPIPDATVDFSLVVRPDADPGGATLSAESATTDSLGIARVDLVAGALETTFQVEASAPQAASAYFTVSVSQAGFAHVSVAPYHEGWRDVAGFERIELRLYRAGDATCAAIDPDAPPESVFPPRSLSSFTEMATYQNVIATQPYTVVAWALAVDNPTRLAFGCAELGAAQVPPTPFALALAVRDRTARLPGSADLVSALEVGPLAAAAAAAGAVAPWMVLGCVDGPGQLLLDCTADALVADGAVDCDVNGSGSLLTAIEAARGDADEFGCRPGMVATSASLDRKLTAAVAAGGPFPTGTELETLLAARADLLGMVELRSRMEFYDGGLLRHILSDATVVVGGEIYSLPLALTSRPVLAALASAAIDDQRHLVVGEHGFTLRYGSLAGEAFAAAALPPAGLAGRELDLGAALAGSAVDASSSTSGCAAVSAILCGEIAQPSGCAINACQQAAAALDQSFTHWWRRMDGDGVDLVLGGSVPLIDADDDLWFESLGGDGEGGSWQVRWSAEVGTDLPAEGTFLGTTPVDEP